MVKRSACRVKPRGRKSARGFTYLVLLVAIVILSLGLTGASEIWQTSARRQKMVELDWRGAQYANAIASFYEATPGLAKVYPPSIEVLLEDRRFAVPRRHLRERYANPVVPGGRWEYVVGSDGRIRGVRSVVPWLVDAASREWIYAARIIQASS